MTLPDTRKCLECSRDFTIDNPRQVFCKSISIRECEICLKFFEIRCGKRRRCCSKSCGSKLIRREQGERSILSCRGCGDDFKAVITGALYCKKVKAVACEGCGNTFKTVCSGQPKKYCTTSCRNKTMRAVSYKIKGERTCEYCGTLFQPAGSGQKYCGNDYKECEMCGESFKIYFNRERLGINKTCSNSCSTLLQSNSKIPKELINEYRDCDNWARNFKSTVGRKPTLTDFEIVFKTSPPRGYDKSLFVRYRSGFEEKVNDVLLKYDHEVLRNKRVIRKPGTKGNTGLLELDFYLPDLGIAFEVQDFASHSRDKEGESSCYGGVKNGPSYHNEKSLLCAAKGIKLYEIWEDEIYSGEYKVIIQKALESNNNVS